MPASSFKGITMKAALVFLVVAVAAALAQAADYNGVVQVEKAVPANLVSTASCLLSAVREAFSVAARVVGVCLSEPQNISVCIMEIIPQVFQDARFAFRDCQGTA
ncbi:uncharacterized protein LOC117647383 [Thrips palmi]|uniref:Uncharacterized protein LOC117647383 n=1 Tax=Thrips palmi TaxID=161013 RepID=A0A6P8Z5B2_THRPL|nr:uncharacterized protein LOC117647383 [Thrips palmi]